MPRPKSGSKSKLSETQIYERALSFIDNEGVEALSMRRLAATLGVDPMALYYYVPNKEALLQGVYDLVLKEMTLGTDTTKSWQGRLRSLGRNVRALALRHPKLFPHLMVSESVSEREFEIFEGLYSLLAEAGLSERAIAQASCVLFTFITGFALHEVNGTLAQLSPGEEGALEALSPERFPYTHRLNGAFKSRDSEVDFEYGLELLIRGLQQGV